MNLNELKGAAKRIPIVGVEVFGANAKDITHMQALEAAARIHGFRDYHEAQTRLSKRDLVGEVLLEPGGLFSTAGIGVDISRHILASGGRLNVFGPSGVGKSVLCAELALRAMQCGHPVRILDLGGAFRRLTQMVNGDFIGGGVSDAGLRAWSSSAPWVCIEMEYGFDVPLTDFSALRGVPSHAFVLLDEFYRLSKVYRPIPAAICVHVDMDGEALPAQSDQTVHFSRGAGATRPFTWTSKHGSVEGKHVLGPRRVSAFSSDSRHVKALGRYFDPDKFDALVAQLESATNAQLGGGP